MEISGYNLGVIHAGYLKNNKAFNIGEFEKAFRFIYEYQCELKYLPDVIDGVVDGLNYDLKQRNILLDKTQLANILSNYKDSSFIGYYVAYHLKKEEKKLIVNDYIKAIKLSLRNGQTYNSVNDASSVSPSKSGGENTANRKHPSGNSSPSNPFAASSKSRHDSESFEPKKRSNDPKDLNDAKKRLALLYSELLRLNYEVGTYESFIDKLSSESKRRAIYNELMKNGYSLGTFENFQSKVIEGISLFKPATAASPTFSSTSSSTYSSSSSSSSAHISTSSSSSSISTSSTYLKSSTSSSSRPSGGSDDSDDTEFIKSFFGVVAALAFIGGLTYLIFFFDTKPDNNYNDYNNYPVLINPNGNYRPIFRHSPKIRKICDIDLYFYSGTYVGKGELFNVDGELAVKRNHYTEYHPVTRIYTNFDYYFKDGSLTYYFNY